MHAKDRVREQTQHTHTRKKIAVMHFLFFAVCTYLIEFSTTLRPGFGKECAFPCPAQLSKISISRAVVLTCRLVLPVYGAGSSRHIDGCRGTYDDDGWTMTTTPRPPWAMRACAVRVGDELVRHRTFSWSWWPGGCLVTPIPVPGWPRLGNKKKGCLK
jgi:hypothetical protein